MLKKRALERIVRSFGNHRRIEMLDLLSKNPELNLTDIASSFKINIQTASEHVRKLTISGLVMKKSQGRNIRHKLTKRGSNVLTFLQSLD